MGIFRKRNKIQLTHLKSHAVKVVYQEHDFPTIDLIFEVKDETGKTELTEVTISMTLWEANEMCKDFLRTVSNTTRLQVPRTALAVPWE